MSLGRTTLQGAAVALTAENTRRTRTVPVERTKILKRTLATFSSRTDLSHLSLLFLHGSQFIAFRVRFAGRESSGVSREGELCLGRTSSFAGAVLVIADRDGFRCFG